jgi:hypothetical protein
MKREKTIDIIANILRGMLVVGIIFFILLIIALMVGIMGWYILTLPLFFVMVYYIGKWVGNKYDI